MGEVGLPKDEAMLFIFPYESRPEFWMKNTKIPLDILFINDNDIIVYMVKNAQPCKTEKWRWRGKNHSRLEESNE